MYKKVVVLDLCRPLIEQAKKRVEARGWKNVELVVGDATDESLIANLTADFKKSQSTPSTSSTSSTGGKRSASVERSGNQQMRDSDSVSEETQTTETGPDNRNADSSDSSSSFIKSQLPGEGTVDIVTFSYSLTMIPDWEKSLEIAMKMLKPGGYIGISDFTVHEKKPLERRFWQWVFHHDNVHPSEKHIPKLRSLFNEVICEKKYGGFPYVPGFAKAPYYFFVGQKPLNGQKPRNNQSAHVSTGS